MNLFQRLDKQFPDQARFTSLSGASPHLVDLSFQNIYFTYLWRVAEAKVRQKGLTNKIFKHAEKLRTILKIS